MNAPNAALDVVIKAPAATKHAIAALTSHERRATPPSDSAKANTT